MSAAALPPRRAQPALAPSFALSALVHLALLAVMFLGVRFQSHPPAVVNVELWDTPPPAVVQEPIPPPPQPKPVPEPEPQTKQPEIALPEKPKAKPKPPPKRDLAFERRLREQMANEQKQLEEQRLRDLIARQQADLRARTTRTWIDKISAKIRGNIILPQDIPGNPAAIFDVTILPTGEVITVRKKKSSGHSGYDDAVERAILKSSPLPQPDDRSIFDRRLELTFRPQDR